MIFSNFPESILHLKMNSNLEQDPESHPRKDSLKKPTNLIEIKSGSVPRTQITDLKPVLAKNNKFQPSIGYQRSKSSIKPQGFEYSTTSPKNKSRNSVYSRHSEKNVYGFDEKSIKSENSEGNYSAGNFDSIFSQKNQKDNVKVCIRVRPLNSKEKNGGGKNLCVAVDGGTVVLDRGYDSKKFQFDYVGEEEISQLQIFNQIAKPIADSCMGGYNGTIFAYGQTGAGKTYTIQGPMIDVEGGGQQMALQNGINDPKGNRGILQRSYEYIFQNIEAQTKLVEEKADGSEISFLIKCSYLEIYNEQIMDLLEPVSVNLQVREDIKKGVYVEGLQEEVVNSYRDMVHLIQKGSKNRHVGSTSMNRESSRSHSVLTTIIESKSLSHTGVWNLKTSRFHIIDLAGSERSKNTNTVGERLKEAGMINKSLSALGNVINSLVDQSEGKNRHIPYRDSKLTFILRDSLGGNSKTVIIANISPSAINVGETLSTLEFAKRAKQIKNKAVVNEDSSGTILVLKTEIKRLKKDLMEQNKMHHSTMKQQQTCRTCKSNMVMDSLDDQGHNPNEDSMLLDLDSSQQLTGRSSRKTQQQNERIQHVEKLLCQNLENLTTQQQFYESEIQKLKDQLSSANQAYEALNSQHSREQMKMKYCESKISKLESENGLDTDENIHMLNEQIQILKKQLEIEQKNPTKLMKIQSDYQQLKEKNKQLEKEIQLDPMSINKQFNDQAKLIEQLNAYINNKCGIEAVQNSGEHMEELQQKYDILLQQNCSVEETNQKLTREFGKSKVEIQQQNEQIENQIALLQDQSQQLSTLDQSQINSQKETKQNIKKLEEMQVKLEDLILNINSLETKIQTQNDQINQKDEQIQELASAKDELQALSNDFQIQEEKCQDLENQIDQIEQMKKQDFDMNKDQILQLSQEISQYEGQIENLQNQIGSKVDDIQNLQYQIKAKNDEKKSKEDKMNLEVTELEEQIKEYTIQIETLSQEKQTQIQEMKNQIEMGKKDNERLELVIKENEQEIQEKIEDNQTLINENEALVNENEVQINEKEAKGHEKEIQIHEIETQIKEKESQIQQLNTQISFLAQQHESKMSQQAQEYDLQAQLQDSQISDLDSSLKKQSSDFNSLLEQKHIEFQQKVQKFETQTSVFELNLKTQSLDFQTQLQAKQHEINEISAEFEDLKNVNRVKENEKSYLDESILEMNSAITDRQNDLFEKEQQIEAQQNDLQEKQHQIQVQQNDLNQKEEQIQSLQKQVSNMQEQVSAAKTLISEKNNVTAGQEQEVAENQVLLLEAHNLINQKVKECDELKEKNNQKDANLGELRQQVEECLQNLNKLESHLKKKQEEIKQLEVEKDNLQFKRDENTKNIEHKLKENKKKVKELENENDDLQGELEKLKNGELYAQNQKIENLLEQLQEKSEKQAGILKEVGEMQVFIDDLQDQLNHQKRQSSEFEKIKKYCYTQKEFIENCKNSCLAEGPEQKQIIKECLSQILYEFSEFQVSNDQSMEIKLIISQIICEISRLYEQQIVLEKQKASGDFKKCTEKYEKQKVDIKQMQSYHANKMNEVVKERGELERQIQEKSQEIEEFQKQQYQTEEVDKLQSDLQKYQIYLNEAETLLNEVNNQNQDLKKELFDSQENLTRYESEILDLNKNLKNQKKMVLDQKQLYEVRLQSQEQEIEQHQYRYKDLEQKCARDIHSHEQKFNQVQQHVEMQQEDREQQMQEMQNQVMLVQENDQEQRQMIANLGQRVQKREYELAEAVKTLKHFSESNKGLQQENESLKFDLEQMAGHRNPNQKIQLHLKIKEENNKLREDNFKLQEMLQKKPEILSPVNNNKKSKEIETLMNHILSCPQFEKMAVSQNILFDGTHSLQKIIEIITIADEFLEEKRILPPRPQLQKQTYRSPAGPVDRGSGGQRGMQPKMISSSASAQQIITNNTAQSKITIAQQIQKSSRTGSQIRANSNSSRNMLQQHINNNTEKPTLANSGVYNNNSQAALSIGSPVMLNSYSSLYKNQVRAQGETKDALIQMRPEKENTLQHQMSQTQQIAGYAGKYRSSQTHMPENQKPRDSQLNNYK